MGASNGFIHYSASIAVSILNLVADPMHIIDLGVAHHIVSSVLWMMCYLPRFFPAGNNASERCDMLWRRVAKYKKIQRKYARTHLATCNRQVESQYLRRHTPVQLSNLHLSFVCDPTAPRKKFPVLTSRVNAAETRHRVR